MGWRAHGRRLPAALHGRHRLGTPRHRWTRVQREGAVRLRPVGRYRRGRTDPGGPGAVAPGLVGPLLARSAVVVAHPLRVGDDARVVARELVALGETSRPCGGRDAATGPLPVVRDEQE